MVFYWNLSDNKCLQVSKTLLSILADLNNAVAWMVSICPLISNSSKSLSKILVTVLSTLIKIGISIPHIFHSRL